LEFGQKVIANRPRVLIVHEEALILNNARNQDKVVSKAEELYDVLICAQISAITKQSSIIIINIM
jgi:hypothetical protein